MNSELLSNITCEFRLLSKWLLCLLPATGSMESLNQQPGILDVHQTQPQK